MSFDELMVRAEVAQLLRVSVRTVDRLSIEDLEFPAPMRIGRRRVAYRRAEVEAYLRGRGLTARLASRLRQDSPANDRHNFGYLVASGPRP